MFRFKMLTLLVFAATAAPALAGPFFKRSSKPEPAEHVPNLIKTLQDDADESKRESAAEELREYDLRQFPDAMPALIEALKNDPSHSVRHEVVNTISKMRPISQTAGFALEEAAANDNSFRVRTAAKAALVHWTLVLGYRQGRVQELNQTEEPPLANPAARLEMKRPQPAAPPLKDKPTAGHNTSPAPQPPPAKPSKSFLSSIFTSKSNKPDDKPTSKGDDKLTGPMLNAPK